MSNSLLVRVIRSSVVTLTSIAVVVVFTVNADAQYIHSGVHGSPYSGYHAGYHGGYYTGLSTGGFGFGNSFGYTPYSSYRPYSYYGGVGGLSVYHSPHSYGYGNYGLHHY